LHDGNARGGPCVRFAAVHWLNAGTIDARSGLAPFGRGCAAFAADAITITPIAAIAMTVGRAIFLMDIYASSPCRGCS
jgi:hypothetical protein